VIGRAAQPARTAHDRHGAVSAEGCSGGVCRAHASWPTRRRCRSSHPWLGWRRWWRVPEIERDIARDVQIQPAVAVVVSKRAAGGPAIDGNTGLHRDIRESPVAQIPEQPIGAEVGDVEIGCAVVVDIADTDALAPSLVADACGRRHVTERAIAVVAKERSCRHTTRIRLERAAIDQVEVEPAIAVEVQQRYS
jgi:hypothetical protein